MPANEEKPPYMSIATINRFIRLFDDAFRGLGRPVAMPDVERLAMLVHSSMDQPRRAYHTSGHVFGLCEGLTAPRQVLAGLFHDVVYVQLDNGFPKRAENLLQDVVDRDGDELELRAWATDDVAVALCGGVFGFRPGQFLPLFGGLNEFLSAVAAVKLLRPYVEEADLLAIAACIEATVAFRGLDDTGQSAAQRLRQRLQRVARDRHLALDDAALDRMVIDAVELANRDVASFADAAPGHFLSNTWLLIEESNAPLAAVGVYSIQQYRGALARMERFLSTLNPAHVFQSHAGVPTPARMRALERAARKNLEFSSRYLGAKMVAAALVEALALATGGDCPVSMFLGDIKGHGVARPDRVEDFLPRPPQGPVLDAKLLRVLKGGRSQVSSNDLTDSPLAAFVYRCLGEDGMRRALEQAKRMFDGGLLPREFLRRLDGPMVKAVAEACAHIALSRREALLAIAARR